MWQEDKINLYIGIGFYLCTFITYFTYVTNVTKCGMHKNALLDLWILEMYVVFYVKCYFRVTIYSNGIKHYPELTIYIVAIIDFLTLVCIYLV